MRSLPLPLLQITVPWHKRRTTTYARTKVKNATGGIGIAIYTVKREIFILKWALVLLFVRIGPVEPEISWTKYRVQSCTIHLYMFSEEMASRNISTAECSICMEIQQEPKLLPCSHSFCLGCLKRYAGKILQCTADQWLMEINILSINPFIFYKVLAPWPSLRVLSIEY